MEIVLNDSALRSSRHSPFPPRCSHAGKILHVGPIDSSERLLQAYQAMVKLSRASRLTARLVLVASDIEFLPGTNCALLHHLSLADAAPFIDTFAYRNRLLLPIEHEVFGNVTLSAISSGLPIEGMNYSCVGSVGGTVRGFTPRRGDAFIQFIEAVDDHCGSTSIH